MVYTVDYCSAIKGNAIMPFAATWMDLEIIMLGGVGQTEKDRYHVISLTCGILKKKDTNELVCRAQTDSQTYRVNLWLPGGWGGMDWEFGIDMYTLLYLK